MARLILFFHSVFDVVVVLVVVHIHDKHMNKQAFESNKRARPHNLNLTSFPGYRIKKAGFQTSSPYKIEKKQIKRFYSIRAHHMKHRRHVINNHFRIFRGSRRSSFMFILTFFPTALKLSNTISSLLLSLSSVSHIQHDIFYSITHDCCIEMHILSNDKAEHCLNSYLFGSFDKKSSSMR